MLPDALTTASRGPLTFDRRAEPAELPELMDQPCAYEEFRDCLHDLAHVNRLMRAYTPTLNFLDRIAASGNLSEPLRILDVGFGGGDTLRAIAHWAAQRSIIVELTGIDLNPYAMRAAQELGTHDPLAPSLDLITADVFRYRPQQQPDVIVSALFTHHLSSSEIVRFVRWMEEQARLGWFINDLERSSRAAWWFRFLSMLFGWHRFVRHDGPVSLRRAFRENDWQRLLREANVANASIESNPMCRLCVARVQSGDGLKP
jgi:2-polyprenyl-3-methyl-5-hydroxy-6-metoxy-1,4-benzoquinol methylase